MDASKSVRPDFREYFDEILKKDAQMVKETGGPFVVYRGEGDGTGINFGSHPAFRGIKHYWRLPLYDPRNAELKMAMEDIGIPDSWAKPPGSS